MKFVVFTLGCKVNQYESQAVISKIIAAGHEASESIEYADCYVINTCAVTAEAERKSRQAVARLKAKNPDAPIFVMGCGSQHSGESFIKKDGVYSVSGTGGKAALADKIIAFVENGCRASAADQAAAAQTAAVKIAADKTAVGNTFDGACGDRVLLSRVENPPDIYEDDLFPSLTRTRGYIKVQDGCNNFCSYCIVPYLRGRSRSRPLASIVDEVKRAANETKEVVLTGINLSAYGKDTGTDLTALIRALDGIKIRKRLGSLECGVITKEFLTALKDGGVCNHFHLSMQSGSNTVLKRMNRHYTKEEFIEKVALIREYFPSAGIMTDIIAGFPEETESEFGETLDTVNRIRFSDAHVFPYSERGGTKAAQLEMVDKSVRRERAAELIRLCERHKAEFLDSMIGSIQNVYVEDNGDIFNTGYTENYIKVYTNAPKNEVVKLKLKEKYKDGVKAENG